MAALGGTRELAVEKWRELDEQDKLLAQRKKELESAVVSLRERRKELTVREEAFRETERQYGKSIRDIEMRRDRALAVAAAERIQLDQKNDEISELKSEVRRLQIEKDALLHEHQQNEMHQFLERIIETSNGELKRTKDVVPKYELLKSMHQELFQKHLETEKATEDEKHNIPVAINKWKENISELLLRISELEERVSQARIEEEQRRREWDDAISAETGREVQAKQMKSAILNMATKIAKHWKRSNDVKVVVGGELLQHLNDIQQYLEDLSFAVDDIHNGPHSRP